MLLPTKTKLKAIFDRHISGIIPLTSQQIKTVGQELHISLSYTIVFRVVLQGMESAS